MAEGLPSTGISGNEAFAKVPSVRGDVYLHIIKTIDINNIGDL